MSFRGGEFSTGTMGNFQPELPKAGCKYRIAQVFAFFGWLAGHYPHLLPREKQGDPYQQLQSELNGLYDQQT